MQVGNINAGAGFELFLGKHWIKVMTSRDAINALKWRARLLKTKKKGERDMIICFNQFEIEMTREQAHDCSHSGSCDSDVAELLTLPKIKRQLRKITNEQLAAELREYGAWNEQELKDRAENEARIIWIAAGNITETEYERKHK